ncbi:MAG: DegT/DnrJ/EryC1/StrS family aminotransferase [Chloroflexaceae bacterium]|nr:DegT/DnrJ/EryC1/StrS family aminotransferase [Chloroflexaceae bacterium]
MKKTHMKVPFVDLRGQYFSVREEIETAIERVLNRGDYILGEAVHAFEEQFARYCGVDQCVGVDSGLSAIELILRAWDIGSGDEVITTANTFYSTVLPIVACGARPVLVEPDPATHTLDPGQLEAAITPRTRAVIVVHLYGHPADMDPINAIARRYGLKVIEDAAQAHGARYKHRVVGSLGDAAAFSFYPTKNLGAYGDAGAVATNDADLAERVRLLRNLGQRVRNVHELRGFNHRLDTIQAAILSVNLQRLDERNAARRRAVALYTKALAELPVEQPYVAPWAEHVYHLYVIRTDNRAWLQQQLAEAGVATAIHYPTPIHLQPAFADLGYRKGDFPVSERLAQQILSLPMYPGISEEAIRYVADVVRLASSEGKRPAMAGVRAE